MRVERPDSAPFLDITEPGFSVRSEAVRAARDQSWFARTPYGLAVLRYDALRELILHPLLRQGSYRWPAHNGTSGLWSQWWLRIMLNREGADHARLRKLGTPAFAPRLVSALLPEFQALAEGLVSRFAARGECEFMSQFADPYAAGVICSLIGLPGRQADRLAELAVQMGRALGVDYARDEAIVDAATEELFAFTRQVVSERRANPKDDFIGALISANADKDALSDLELHDMIVLAVFGGIDTTRNQLGLAMQVFLEHPDQWQLLGDNPDLARAAVEEVMRVRPTATWVTREATETFAYRGLEIPQGTTIHLFSYAAGTDPEHFEGGFDITKVRKRHFGFGGGKHHCIGAPIARGDMAEALKVLSRRMRDVAPGDGAEWLPDSGNTGPQRLPLCFTPEANRPEKAASGRLAGHAGPD